MLASFAGTVRKYLDATHAATVMLACFLEHLSPEAFSGRLIGMDSIH